NTWSGGQQYAYPPSTPASPYPPVAPPVYSQPDPRGQNLTFGRGVRDEGTFTDEPVGEMPWGWRLMPEGLIYRSYMAGVKEPRFGLNISHQAGFGTMWDATLGARFALLRYGTAAAYRPEGFEVDLEGAAMPRLLPLLPSSPLVSTDFRVGVPVTYGRGNWQFK